VEELYTLEGVETHHSYTTFLIRPDHDEVLARGLRFIEETEEEEEAIEH